MTTQAGLWQQGTRQQALARLQQTFDLLVIGGGITGAGIALEGARRGLKVLLLEQRDFAWGTSSRSSKLVHGGLRYLKQGALHLTRESVVERQQLLRDAPGLVQPQSFAFADYPDRKPGKLLLNAGLMVYDLLAGKRSRSYDKVDDFLLFAPHIGRENLRGGSRYMDAKTDDARLVLRVLQEAAGFGATLLNYTPVDQLLQQQQQICGVALHDALTGQPYQVQAKAVVNATGAWADLLRGEVGAKPMLRPLRGSHLLLPHWRLPVAQAISFMHPADGRPVFLYPWEGATLVGTTDLDHHDLHNEASITQAEVDYLLQALHYQFPDQNLGVDDILSTYAGVRPVVNTGKSDPSAEGRDHVVLLEHGLLTVTGGKLTTFRVIALDVLSKLRSLLPDWQADLKPTPIFAAVSEIPSSSLPAAMASRLWGRYGNATPALLAAAQSDELQTIGATDVIWAELRWAARSEGVAYLQDLLLRRTRLGLLLRQGGAEYLPRIGAIACSELGWDDARWQQEQADYLALIQRCYSLPQNQAVVA